MGYSTIVTLHPLNSTTSLIPGGMIEMEIHNIFGLVTTPVFAPVSAESMAIATNLP